MVEEFNGSRPVGFVWYDESKPKAPDNLVFADPWAFRPVDAVPVYLHPPHNFVTDEMAENALAEWRSMPAAMNAASALKHAMQKAIDLARTKASAGGGK